MGDCPETEGQRRASSKLRVHRDIIVSPGELLYIPFGWWHEIETVPFASSKSGDASFEDVQVEADSYDEERWPLNLTHTMFYHPFYVRLKRNMEEILPNPRYRHLFSMLDSGESKADEEEYDEAFEERVAEAKRQLESKRRERQRLADEKTTAAAEGNDVLG